VLYESTFTLLTLRTILVVQIEQSARCVCVCVDLCVLNLWCRPTGCSRPYLGQVRISRSRVKVHGHMMKMLLFRLHGCTMRGRIFRNVPSRTLQLDAFRLFVEFFAISSDGRLCCFRAGSVTSVRYSELSGDRLSTLTSTVVHLDLLPAGKCTVYCVLSSGPIRCVRCETPHH